MVSLGGQNQSSLSGGGSLSVAQDVFKLVLFLCVFVFGLSLPLSLSRLKSSTIRKGLLCFLTLSNSSAASSNSTGAPPNSSEVVMTTTKPFVVAAAAHTDPIS